MENLRDNQELSEALPRLASSMKSVLADAHIQILENHQIDIRFDGLPAWKIHVTRQLLNNQLQMFVTHIDLFPLCLASLSFSELQRLAAIENLGLRGVTVTPVDPGLHDGRGGLRVRASFVGQKGRSTDEVENLTVDIMNVLAFARTLEDRLTDSAIAGEFSQELYLSRFAAKTQVQPTRIVSSGQSVFDGSTDRVFSEIMRSLKSDLGFQIKSSGQRTALAVAPSAQTKDPIEIVIRIPEGIPVFIAHAPLMKITGKSDDEIATILDDLNSQSESGHFEYNPADQVLCYTAWKQLTNDLRHFSFDHTVLSVNRAYAMAVENFEQAPVLENGGKVLQFPTPQAQAAKKAA